MADKPRPFPANSETRAQDLKLQPAAPLSLPPPICWKTYLCPDAARGTSALGLKATNASKCSAACMSWLHLRDLCPFSGHESVFCQGAPIYNIRTGWIGDRAP